jgi:cell division protein FtsI/penicillin-binding protein 2
MEQEKVHVRLLILAAFVLFWMTAVFGRVAYLQLFLHGDYLTRAARQQRHTIDIYPKRGVIYDRNMHPLAMSVPVQSAFAVPAEIKDRWICRPNRFARNWIRAVRSCGSNGS